MKPAILVADVHTRAQIAALRSLGRAGYRVHAVSQAPDALGLKSRLAEAAVLHPDPLSPSFADWLADYCRTHDIRMIVPSGSVLAGVRDRFWEFKSLLPVSDNPEVVFGAGNKAWAHRRWQEAGLLANVPPTIISQCSRPVPAAALGDFPRPLFVKAGRAGRDPEGEDYYVCATPEEAEAATAAVHALGFADVLVQGGVGGRQAGVSLMMGPDGPMAANCVVDGHKEPHSRGTMSLRRSDWNDALYADAVRRMQALGWIGCAMVEYRVEDDGTFWAIETNARFWLYLHLDIHAGVDFPRLLAEWFLEGKVPPPILPRQGVVCRDTFPGEVAALANAVRGGGALGASARFIGRSLDPRIYRDLSFPADRTLYWRELGRFLRSEARSILRRFAS